MSKPETKKDYFFASIGSAFWFATPVLALFGIWSDARWFATAALAFVVGTIALSVSNALDKKWAKEGRKP